MMAFEFPSAQHGAAQCCRGCLCVRCGARRASISEPPAHSKCAARCTPANRIIHTGSEREQKHISLRFKLKTNSLVKREGVCESWNFSCTVRFESHARTLYMHAHRIQRETVCVELPGQHIIMQPCAASTTAVTLQKSYILCIIYIWPNEILAVLLQPSSSSSQHLLWNAIRAGDIIPAP